MAKYYIDAGTTWTKILKIENDNKKYSIIKSSELKNLEISDTDSIRNTGHTLINYNSIYENEVVALSYGAREYLLEDYIVLDLGSRDIKYVRYQDKKFKDMDWNSSCASATGATIEMLLKFYDVRSEDLKYNLEKYSVTCGIFGLERIMDDISKGESPKVAISKFIHGIAYRAYHFAKKPDKICISGGFCENRCFIESLSKYSKVVSLGRFVLVDGLSEIDKLNNRLNS